MKMECSHSFVTLATFTASINEYKYVNAIHEASNPHDFCVNLIKDVDVYHNIVSPRQYLSGEEEDLGKCSSHVRD